MNNISASFTSFLNDIECPYRIEFTDNTVLNDNYEYEVTINGQDYTNEFPNDFIVPQNGEYIISRMVNDPSTNCFDIQSDTINATYEDLNVTFDLEADSTECIGIYQVINLRIDSSLTSTEFSDQDGNLLFVNSEGQLSTGNGVTSVTLKAFVSEFQDICFDEETINIDNVVNLKVPNLFTPNGDSNNDILRVVVEGDEFLSSLQCIKTCRFQVFDRWGNEVFSTTDPDLVGWDGMINGSPAPPEMYMYIIETYYYGDPDDDEVNCSTQAEFKNVFKGNVLLQY